jgi:hypothetical protein
MNNIVAKTKTFLASPKGKTLVVSGLAIAAAAILPSALAAGSAATLGANQLDTGASLLNAVCDQVGKYKVWVAGALFVWKAASAGTAYFAGQPGAPLQAGVGVIGATALMVGPGIALGMLGITGTTC